MKKIIKNQRLFYCIIVLCSIIPISGIAGIYFMEKPEEPINRNLRPCFLDYKLTSCKDNKVPDDLCPKDNKYFKKCICPEKYQYDNSNCTDNKALSGAICEAKYETCSCPQDYSKTCSGVMIGNSESCDGKYKSCKCSGSYQSCQYGGAASASQCVEENGTVKWSECKVPSCEEGGYLSYVPTNQTCSSLSFANKTCYKDCRALTCADGGYQASIPSGQTCTAVSYAGKTCYKDCRAVTPPPPPVADCSGCSSYGISGGCRAECQSRCKSTGSVPGSITINGKTCALQ